MKNKLAIILPIWILIMVLYLQNFSGVMATPIAVTNKTSSIEHSSISTANLPELFTKVKDSVVEINIIGNIVNPRISVDDMPVTNPFAASGSGFIYDKKGNIVTNYHVIQGAETISVRLPSGYSYSAKIVGSDPISDLAVVQLDPSVLPREKLIPLPIANSSNVQVGESTVAVGSPQGLTNSMTVGIVSQTNRVEGDANLYRYWVGDLIQTDADINPGNSGGPLINSDGDLIGVNDFNVIDPGTGVASPGLNFAISSNVVQRVVPQLISQGFHDRPWIGIVLTDVTPVVAQKVGLEQAGGIIAVNVTPNSPAHVAGIAPSDIIFGIDDIIIREKSDIINYMQTKVPGESAVLDVMGADGIRRDVNLKIGSLASSLFSDQ